MKRFFAIMIICFGAGLMLAGCVSNDGQVQEDHKSAVSLDSSNDIDESDNDEKNYVNQDDKAELDEEDVSKMHISATIPVKNPMNHNPVMTQSYSADPYALVYDGRVYLYMTGDKTMYEADGSIKKNDYSNINTLHVVSSDDMVNWTDHGEILAAGKDGAASWGNNSWAPAACWKEIDGKPRFFLYFANSGNGIAVLTADSPTGPFSDPLGGPIVSRKTPTCNEVTWLFDPAVLVDDDGTGYLYFGGGIPSPDKANNPGTARVAKLSDDMIHLDGDPVPIANVEYLFEDSGINKVGDKYIYSYCSNFNVPAEYARENGFGNGEIITMVGSSPMGPFEKVGSILKNPEEMFSYGGNNHHCVFMYNDQWYITYHASLIEEKLGANNGYRSVNVDVINVNDDGLFAPAKGTREGVSQIRNFNPFEESSFSTMSNQAGISVVASKDSDCNGADGRMAVLVKETGAFTQITGADFGEGAKKCYVTLKSASEGRVCVRAGLLNSEDIGTVSFDVGQDFSEYEMELNQSIRGVQDIYFVFDGQDIILESFRFE